MPVCLCFFNVFIWESNMNVIKIISSCFFLLLICLFFVYSCMYIWACEFMYIWWTIRILLQIMIISHFIISLF